MSKMISQRRGLLLVLTLFLISLTDKGFCQAEDESVGDPPETSSQLPDFPADYELSPSITDQKPKTSLTFDQSTFPPFTSKSEVTSEPPVAATTQTIEPTPSETPSLDKVDRSFPVTGPPCLKVCLQAYFEIPYMTTGETGEVTNKTAIIPITEKADIGGKCGNGKNNQPTTLQLQWGGDEYTLKITFKKTRSGATDNWVATPIQFTYNTEDSTYFDNARDAGRKVVSSNSEFFESPWRKSFKCESDTVVTMTSKDKLDTSLLTIETLQVQPFMDEKVNGTWGKVEQCENDKIVKPTSNVASVAVGATLGCLILIVIIVYAVGRKMGSITDRTGYKAVE